VSVEAEHYVRYNIVVPPSHYWGITSDISTTSAQGNLWSIKNWSGSMHAILFIIDWPHWPLVALSLPEPPSLPFVPVVAWTHPFLSRHPVPCERALATKKLYFWSHSLFHVQENQHVSRSLIKLTYIARHRFVNCNITSTTSTQGDLTWLALNYCTHVDKPCPIDPELATQWRGRFIQQLHFNIDSQYWLVRCLAHSSHMT
jgi:hypothetical protein